MHGRCRTGDLRVASVTDVARLVDHRQEQRAVSSVREPRVSTARIVAVRSRNDPCGFRDLRCRGSSWPYLPSSSAREPDKDRAVTERFQRCISRVWTALMMTLMRLGLMWDLRKICQDFSRAMPLSTSARAADRARFWVRSVRGSSPPGGRCLAVVTQLPAPM